MYPPITLKQIDAGALVSLQELYEASAGYFLSHGGAAARPEQAAIDYQNVLESGDRVLLGIWWQREALVGCFDLRFHHPAPGVVWFGALILRDELPAERSLLETWAARILEEWLRLTGEMQEIRLALLISDRQRVRFWTELGYQATPEGMRQPVGGKSQRFVIYRKPIPSSS